MTFDDDIIDVRDLIARYEELEEELSPFDESEDTGDYTQGQEEDAQEFQTIKDILSDLEGYGGDEQWRGDWYPVILIRDSHFTDYAQQLTEDIGDIPREIPTYIVIDWEATANNIQQDYSMITIGDSDYWYR